MENCFLSTITKNNRFEYWDINHNSRECLGAPLVVNVAACTNADTYSSCSNKSGRLDFFLMYVISGELFVKTEHGSADIRENDLVVIPPKTPYFFDSKTTPFCYLCVHFTGSQALEKLRKYELRAFPEVNVLCPQNHLQQRFKTLFEAIAKNDEYRENELGLLLERLLIEAARGIKSKADDLTPLSKSIRYINEFYHTEIRTTELAKMENMCMTTYNLHFKKQVGMPPTKYIQRLRMEYAMSLLETSNMSVTEVGILCGYADVNFFSRTFKAYVGISPKLFRKRFEK